MKILKLIKFALARYDDSSPYPIGDLEIKVNGLPKYQSADIRFVARINGKEITKLAISEDCNVAKIPQGLLECGEFTCVIVVYSHGRVVEEYDAEPLIITDVNGQFFADPFIRSLTASVQEMQERLDKGEQEYSEKINTLDNDYKIIFKQQIELLNKFADKIILLTNFAQTCIQKIPYISDYKFSEDIKND